VRPGTYPIEPDAADSWAQPNGHDIHLKLRRGVRWNPKPPVNGRELTAADVSTPTSGSSDEGNGNRSTLESVDKIEALDRYTVKFHAQGAVRLVPRRARLSTSMWLVAKEAVEKFGDLKRAEAVICTGP